MKPLVFSLIGCVLLACTTIPEDETPDDETLWHSPCATDTLEQRMMDVGEVSLNVTCRGEGPTVVFLHGFPEFHYSWNKVMDSLAENYRLIAPDQRGYNLSDKPEEVEAYELPHLAKDILNLLPMISDDPVLLVAHDWGGPVGWLVAHHEEAHIRGFISTNGPHPARFVDLISNDPAQQEASEYMTFFRSPSAEQFITADSLAAEFAAFLTEEELDLYRAAWAQPGAITGGLNWYRANPLTVDSIDAIMATVSPTVNVPVSVLWGLDDSAVLASNADGLEPFAPDLEIQTFEGVDHWIEHRIPEDVAAAIIAMDQRAQ